MERRILGTENLIMLDGTEREVNVYAVGYAEKWRLVNKYSETKFEKGYQYKVVDEVSIRDAILKIALKEINLDDLDSNCEYLYDKYFTKNKEFEKKEKTSTSGQMDTQSPVNPQL